MLWMIVILMVLAAAAIAFVATNGVPRAALRPFQLKARLMTADQLGFAAHEPADVIRINEVCEAFAGGFNSMLTTASPRQGLDKCEAFPVFYRPFAHEGAAMAFSLTRLGKWGELPFEREIVGAYEPYKYLYYVGLGFWWAKRGFSAAQMRRRAGGLDRLYCMLCFDGYGFKHGFFDFGTHPACVEKLERLSGYARNAAYQGLGRSFLFRFINDQRRMWAVVTGFGEAAKDIAGGIGLAAVFMNADRLERAFDIAELVPGPLRSSFQMGMVFGFKARALNHPAVFDGYLARVAAPQRRVIRRCIEECDAIERAVRLEMPPEPYREWRARLTDWLDDQVDFPLASMRQHAPLSQPVAAGHR